WRASPRRRPRLFPLLAGTRSGPAMSGLSGCDWSPHASRAGAYAALRAERTRRREARQPLRMPACDNRRMRTILNISWGIFAGFWLWVGYVFAGILLCIPSVTIPWALASFRIARYSFWPFGREVVDKPTSGLGSRLGNVIWV